MKNIYKESLNLHREKIGKLEIKSKVKIENINDLSLAYTPGVAEVCKVIAEDASETKKLTLKGNTIAVISDGSAILGLGNLGPEAAIPVMEGKCVLFKELAQVDAFPICLETQNTEEIIKTIKYISPVFGGINLEDISAPRCFEIESRLKQELDIPVMHDDQHGAATVILAGLVNSLKLLNIDKEDIKILVNGAGAAGVATVKLLVGYGVKNIIVCDSVGAIYEGRDGLNEAKKELARITNKDKIIGELAEIIKNIDIFIGLSKADILKPEMIKSMSKRPVIFALANPIPEIMPESAKEAGAYIVATGRSDYPNQINNVLAFPGIFRGALDNDVQDITPKILIRVAETLANMVEDLSVERILPAPLNKNVAKQVAKAIY